MLKPLESLHACRHISKSFEESSFIQMLFIGNGREPKPYSGYSSSSLWLCIPTWILQLRPLPVMSRIEYSCNPCKAPFQVLKLYQWPLRATAGEEGMPALSCSFQAGSWRPGCRGRWSFQQLPVETAALLVMFCKTGWLLAWEVCTEPKPSKKTHLSKHAGGVWLSRTGCCSNCNQRERKGSTAGSRHKGKKGAGWKQEVFCQKEWRGWWKEHQTEPCPSRGEEIQMGIFLLGTRQDYTKSETVREG